jgi:hypothetical protein
MTTRTQLGSFLFLSFSPSFCCWTVTPVKFVVTKEKKSSFTQEKEKKKKNKLECEEEEEASGYSILALGLARRLCVDKSRKTKIFVKK